MIWEDDIIFINILNRFQIASQTNEDIKCINNNCLRTPPMDNTLPYLFYINIKTTMHNKNVFWNTLGQTFTFLACVVHVEMCLSHFKLSNLSSQIASLHYKIIIKKKCWWNYVQGIMKH